ncbi:ATP-dependent DNA ligase [Candidatus Pacearchaeota archaeon]|nr:ATP-dependent DNA ligase [Candidatus Pacearchaeota archaeon]
MRYEKLVEFYEEASSTTKRLEKITILSKFLKSIHESDKDVLYLLMGDIYPEYDERKIGISTQLAIKAMAKATGTDEKHVTTEWKHIGDLGEVAKKLKSQKRQSTLHHNDLTLLTSASPTEALYLVRTLLADLRIGVKESTIREAMVDAFFPDEKKEASQKIQDAIDKSNDISAVFEIVKKGELKKLDKVMVEVGKPLKVMLAQKIETIKEGFEQVGKPAAIEFKYDGFRMIIHKKGNEIILYTRNLENVTKQFPDVVEVVKKHVKGDSFILDSEVVGFHKKNHEYRPFQEISQRIRRKYDIEKLQEELPVEVNVFDILYYNGKSLLDEPFIKRTELLRKVVHSERYKIVCSKQIITDDEKKANEFYKSALKERQEGIMMKNLQSIYSPGKRVGHMLKIKPEERDFDLVIVGAEYGTGKRGKWMSSFILACKDEKTGKFLEIGKVGTGIKEKLQAAPPEIKKEVEQKEKLIEEETIGTSFQELTEKLEPLITKEHGKTVEVKPKIIVSVTYQEIQKSPTYSSGYALRFPRFTALREEKPLSEITTLKEVEKDYANQKRNWKYG